MRLSSLNLMFLKKLLPEKAFLTWCEPMFEGGKKVHVQKQTLLFLATK